MKSLVVAAASSAVLVGAASVAYTRPGPAEATRAPATHTAPRAASSHRAVAGYPRTAPPTISNEALTAVVKQTCSTCHSERQKAGNLVLAGFDVATATSK